MQDQARRAAIRIADVNERAGAAKDFAHLSGAEQLILFVLDPVAGLSLPAPGFPQTLREMRRWQELLRAAIANGRADGVVSTAPPRVNARAVGLADGTVAVLAGGAASDDALSVLDLMLPALGAVLRAEAQSSQASVEARMARQAAEQASGLASKLDIARSELQQALDIAERATRARDEFLATVSHELRTPLTSIIGWVQLLREERDLGALMEGLETIDRNARAQSRLIEDILDFSRINAGKLRLDVSATDLADVIRSATETVRPAADAKGISLDAIIDPSAGNVSGDADRLQQVVWNLLSNAVKFTPRGGKVRIELERVNSHAELAIIDNGEGIDSSFLPFVFDRFSQADSSSSRSHAGLGLGLGIVRHLVELHGGRVYAHSEGSGKGATFTVRLPLRAANGARETPSSSTAVLTPGKLRDLEGAKILLVEDYADSRKLLNVILTRAGAVVEEAEDVNAALRLLKSSRPELILSDIEMPGEDGYSLIRKVRANPAIAATPAIALTAYARSVDRVRALGAGFQMHMSKPVEPAELVAAIKSLLSTLAAERVPPS